MVIDVHTHTFPAAMAGRALKFLVEKAKGAIRPVGTGTLECLTGQLAAAGVDRAVVCPIATKPSQFAGILAESLAIRDGERGEAAARRIVPFASVHPADDRRALHLKEIADKGLRGVKVHPYYQECVLDSPGMLDYFRLCRDLGLAVLCHCGFDIGFPPDPVCGPERVARVLDAAPGLVFIAAHLGGWKQWGAAADRLLGRDVYLDTAMTAPFAGDPGIRRLLRGHPADRILFGTDWPWLSFEETIRFLKEELSLTPAALEAILGGNAEKLLRL